MDRQAEALEAAPGPAHAEELHAVEHRWLIAARGLGSSRIENTLPDAGEVAGEDGVVGMARQGRVDDAANARLGFEPARPVRWSGAVLLHAQSEGAEAARGEEAIVGGGAEAQAQMRILERGPGRFIGRDGAEHRVGMAHEHLGAGVHARGRRPAPAGGSGGVAQELSAITVIPRGFAAAAMAGRSCSSKVSEPGFGEDRLRVVAEQGCDLGAEARIVILDRHAHPRQHPIRRIGASAGRRCR